MPVLTSQKCASHEPKVNGTKTSGPWRFSELSKQRATQNFCIHDPGSMFKEYDLQRVQNLEEKLESFPKLLAHKILPIEVANNNGDRYPPRSLYTYGIVCGLKGHLENVNRGNPLNPLDNSSCSSAPLCLLFLCSSVTTVPLFLCAYCSSVPTVPLFLCAYGSSVLTVPLCLLFLCAYYSSVPLFLCAYCSSVPLCLLFLCAFCSSVPSVPLFLCA